MKRRLIIFCISIFSLATIVNLSRSVWNVWQKGSIVSEREAVLSQLKKENTELKQKLAEVNTLEFVEKQARDKLNLQKEGEIVVVLPKEEVAGISTHAEEDPANWQKWWKLFF